MTDEIVPDQRSNLCLLLGQASSLPLSHQGSTSRALSKAQETLLFKPPPDIQGIDLPLQPACLLLPPLQLNRVAARPDAASPPVLCHGPSPANGFPSGPAVKSSLGLAGDVGSIHRSNLCSRIVVLEKTLENLGQQGEQTSPP